MNITREMLTEHREAMLADMNAASGAVQMLEWLLLKLGEEESDDIPIGLDDSCDEA